MPFLRPQLIPGMIESAGIPFIYKKLLCVPGTDPSGAPFKMPCTQVPIESGVQSYYYPSYINTSDQLPNIASGMIPFGSKVEHAEIKTDFTIATGTTQRVGFYYSYDEDIAKNRADNYPDEWFAYNDKLVQVHCLAVIERKAAELFQTTNLYPTGHRLNGAGNQWNAQTVPGESDYNPFTDPVSGMFSAITAAFNLGIAPNRCLLTGRAWEDLRSNTKALIFIKGQVTGSAAEIGKTALLRREWVIDVLSEFAEVDMSLFIGSGKFTPSPVVKAKGSTPPTLIWGTVGTSNCYFYPAPDAVGGMPVEGGQYGWWQGISPLQVEPEGKLSVISKAIACPANVTWGQEVNHKYIMDMYNLHV